jgi:hypothetical protein
MEKLILRNDYKPGKKVFGYALNQFFAETRYKFDNVSNSEKAKPIILHYEKYI